jgi:hypothetical protein
MITTTDLLSSGYRSFKHHERVCDETLYQKTVYVDGAAPVPWRALYSINFFFWYFDKYFPGRGGGTGLSCEARLYLPKENTLVGDAGFTLSMSLSKSATIEQVESFYANAFNVLGCVQDLQNNDGKS